MEKALFAWEGFSFSHPDDWAPVTLSGTRAEGYVRLQGSGRMGCQVRWRQAKKTTDLSQALNRYFELLTRDAKKSKSGLQTDSQNLESGGIQYRWQGVAQGRGALFMGPCGRIFFVEVTGGRSDSLLPHSRALVDSFSSCPNEGLERWSLFGLSAQLPAGLSPAAKVLQSGRTWLTFRPRGAQIEVGRFAFGRELAAKHGIEPWARAALRMSKGIAECQDSGLKLVHSGRVARPVHALVRLDEDQNQLVCIRSATRASKWIPEWDWLASSES